MTRCARATGRPLNAAAGLAAAREEATLLLRRLLADRAIVVL
jgi:hypothetical protein